MKRVLTVAGTLVLFAVSFVGVAVTNSSAAPSATSLNLATISGALPAAMAGQGTIAVFVEPDMSSGVVGESFPLTEVVSGTYSGSAFTLGIPSNALTPALATSTHGEAINTIVQINGNGLTSVEAVPVPENTSAGTTAQSAGVVGVTRSITLATFPAPWTSTTPTPQARVEPHTIINDCNATLESSSEQTTTIGELHTANLTNMKATFNYTNTADSTTTFGVSVTNGGFSLGGQVSVTNSIGTGSSVTEQAANHIYVDSHLYYGDYLVSGNLCGPYYATQPYDAVGDSYTGGSAGESPWGACTSDPHGYGTISPGGGTYGTHNETANDYSDIATVFGFTFGGSTGYTSSIDIKWTNNNSSSNSYVCGSTTVNNSPIIYNT